MLDKHSYQLPHSIEQIKGGHQHCLITEIHFQLHTINVTVFLVDQSVQYIPYKLHYNVAMIVMLIPFLWNQLNKSDTYDLLWYKQIENKQ